MKRTDSLTLTLPGERYTPFSLAKKVGAKAILESASFSHGRDRYSLLMLEEAFRVVQDDEGVAFKIDGKRIPYTNGKDILDALDYVAKENEQPSGGVPIPASGFGYLSYEFAARCDTIHFSLQRDDLKIPESEFIVGHLYIIFDHFTENLHIFALNYDEHEIDLKAALEKLEDRLNDWDFSYMAPAKTVNYPARIVTDLEKSHDEFIDTVKALKEHIVKGNIIQAVPSRRLQIETEVDALEVYRRLRSINPSPYLFYLDFGDHQLVGASPESLVRVRDGVASIRPIAGTCRRGKDSTEDDALMATLKSDPKELAEHLMLVDLARNDLGRVSEPGSVVLTRNMECEKFSHVIHIVSDVQSNPKKEKKSIEVLRAAFPAGTVSGAPKISAIQLISGLEKVKRNFYAGAVGYIQPNGNLDFCIALRCALRQNNNIWTLQAGAGIVHASIPEKEWEETNEKLGAMRQVLETNGI